MSNESFERYTYETAVECEFLLHAPEEVRPGALLILALHGYASNAYDMLRLTLPAVGQQHVIASLQAPNQHYADRPGVNSAAAYNWGIRQHWEHAVRMHQNMIQQVLSRLRPKFGIGPEKTLLLGFSQPVGLNYRFIGTHPGQFGGAIAICGGVPRDWEEKKYKPIDAAILHISRDEDEYYPVPVVQQYPDRLRRYAADVEFHLLPGKHRFPSKAAGVIEAWLQRVFHVETVS